LIKEEDMPVIYVAISDDSHVNTKETEKLHKYKDLEIRSAGCGK
jgi:hypothetical protein